MTPLRHFRTTREGDVLLIDLRNSVGSLDDIAIHRELETILHTITEERPSGVIVDFQHVSYFGSMMLEALRALWNRLEEQGGRLALCNVSDVGREILHIARFDQLWPILDSRATAIDTLRE